MTDDPILASLRAVADAQEGVIVPASSLPHNTLSADVTVTKDEGAAAHVGVEREKGGVSVGAEGSLSQKKGWGASAFVKWVWGK